MRVGLDFSDRNLKGPIMNLQVEKGEGIVIDRRNNIFKGSGIMFLESHALNT